MGGQRYIQHLRVAAAAEALLGAREQLRGQLAPTDPGLPELYGDRILHNDDDYGARAGLVVQSDGVSWAAIEVLYELALYGRYAHRRAAHPGITHALDCDLCGSAEPLGTVALADPICERRNTTMTELAGAVRHRFDHEHHPGP